MKPKPPISKEELDRVSRSVVTGAALMLAVGAGFLGFICWAIYRLVLHVTGAP